MMVGRLLFLLGRPIFRGYVKFPGCRSSFIPPIEVIHSTSMSREEAKEGSPMWGGPFFSVFHPEKWKNWSLLSGKMIMIFWATPLGNDPPCLHKVKTVKPRLHIFMEIPGNQFQRVFPCFSHCLGLRLLEKKMLQLLLRQWEKWKKCRPIMPHSTTSTHESLKFKLYFSY